MKKTVFFLFILPLLFSCSSKSQKNSNESEKIIYQAKDKEILNQIFELFADESESPVESLMVKIGLFFEGTPYVGHTLEIDSTEQLVVNLRELDCTTFAENCLAIAKTIQSKELTFEKFTDELQRIRYRDGVINGYQSRLHYFSDWIHNNQKKLIVRDQTPEISQVRYAKEINFMSTHPESYTQLTENPQMVNIIAEQEKEISGRAMFYIPEDKIAEIEGQLKDGDIAGIATNIEGLDISHVVMLIWKSGHVHLLHASSASSAMKVVVSDITLEEYLLNSKSATGIMVVRSL